VAAAGGTVSATVDAVDAPTDCDAAVRASSAVAALFKDFGGSRAECTETKGERSVATKATKLSDLPTWEVEVAFLAPSSRAALRVLSCVQARSGAAAVALACAKLGRALAAKIDGKGVELEFVEMTVRELAGAAQPQLFPSTDPATWPPLEVAPGTAPELVCECGHWTDRHTETLADVLLLACEACAVKHGRDPKHRACERFVPRDPVGYAKVQKHVRGVPSPGDGVVIDVPSEPKPARKRRARADVDGPDEAA
jgi:hypothetical protein